MLRGQSPSRPLAAVLIAALLIAGAARAYAAVIEYLYVDASEGGGSGGHAGLVLGDRVYHFEHHAPGLVRLAREPFENVRRRYGIADNRTILLHRIPTSESTYDLILDEFSRRYAVQRQHLDDQRALADDSRLLAAALAARRGVPGAEAPPLDGAGFFHDAAAVARVLKGGGPMTPSDASTAAAVVALRERASSALGDDALTRAMEEARGVLAQLAPDDAGDPGPHALVADRLLVGRRSFSRRYQDVVLELLAMDALDRARPLRPENWLRGDGPALEGDEELIDRLAAELEASLVRLLSSRRPDRGFALLIGMARLAALDEARARGRWTVIADGRARDGDRDATAAERVRRRARARAEFDSARAALRKSASSAEAFPELAFASLESALNRLVRSDGARGQEPVDGPGEPGADDRADEREASSAPARLVALRDPHLSALDAPALAGALAGARRREAAHGAELRRLYGYDLFTRNCVTEIFRTIEAALARDVLAREPGLEGEALSMAVRAASAVELGGYVDPDAALNFIPAVSAAAVRERYAVTEVAEIRSYRRASLEAMSRREGALRVFLRESNTLTSTLYRKPRADSAFLFFTDEAVAARPLFGALNLVTGVGVAAAGLAMLPVDRGATLRSGLTGALWSLPELAFFNIRKGTFPDAGDRGAREAGTGPTSREPTPPE